MEPSEAVCDFVKRRENLGLVAYKCEAGIWTIGWGHTTGVKEGMVIDEAMAEKLFRADVIEKQMLVDRAVRVPLLQHQYDALFSMAFNAKPIPFLNSTLIKCVNAKLFDKAAREFDRWVYVTKRIAGQEIKVKSNGLIKRRAQERLIFEQGIYA